MALAYDHAYPHPAHGYAAADPASKLGDQPAVILAAKAAEPNRPEVLAQAR